jgi:pimeloyl-ACP methyl ester carboxylesterase/nucleoside-diphosphate-sugar epimerase
VRSARDIYHLGAAMQFGMAPAVAQRANIDGLTALIALARELPQLRRLVYVGGFKNGSDDRGFLAHGIDPREPFDHARYAPLYRRLGAYEASKMAADHLVRAAARAHDLPLSRVHPGGVIGDSRTGETTQFVGFAQLVEQLWYGKLPAVPGGARHWLPLVAVDFLAGLLARVPEAAAGGTYLALDDRTPMIVDLLRIVAERIGIAAPRRRVPLGLLDALLRARLVPGASPSDAEGISFIVDRRYDVQATTALAAATGLAWPDLTTAIERTVDFLIATRFGGRSAPARARMARVGGSPTFVTGEPAAPYVLLHGLPLDADSWDALAAHLPGPALRADLPGLGRSAPAAATPAEWLDSLTTEAGRPIVVGHSLGTLYALDHAAAHPDRVAGLVLISPFFLQATPPAALRWTPTVCAAGRLVRRKHLEALVAGDPRATTPILDGPAAHLRRPGAGSRFGRALAIAHRRRAHLAVALAELAHRMPITIVHGDRDPLVVAPPPHVRVVTLAGTGHFPQLDQPSAVAAAIRARAVDSQNPACSRHDTSISSGSAETTAQVSSANTSSTSVKPTNRRTCGSTAL